MLAVFDMLNRSDANQCFASVHRMSGAILAVSVTSNLGGSGNMATIPYCGHDIAYEDNCKR